MSLNFSEEQTKNNVTFKELDALIGLWTAGIQESQKEFALQYEELNKLMFGICNCRDKLKSLYERVVLAKCLQENINGNINYIRVRQEDIERLVTKLERDFMSCKCNIPSDRFRQHIYNVAANLNLTYSNFIEGIEEIQTRTDRLKQKYGNIENIEHIAQLLQHQLRQLESIEMKTHDMKNRLNQTEHYKRHVLASLHIKENIV